MYLCTLYIVYLLHTLHLCFKLFFLKNKRQTKKKKKEIRLENLARPCESYLLVVDGEEAEHGSEHGAGGHKVAQTANMVRDEIPANKRGKLHLQSTVTQWDNDKKKFAATHKSSEVGRQLPEWWGLLHVSVQWNPWWETNGEGCYMCLYSGTPGERPMERAATCVCTVEPLVRDQWRGLLHVSVQWNPWWETNGEGC